VSVCSCEPGRLTVAVPAQVIEIIDDIQRIEAAPVKIGALLDARDFVGAVDMFTHSLNLVFSERLVAFHAITGIRNALMECKQVIEDRIVQELQHVVYLKVSVAGLHHLS
jgi:hypothetical protein